MAVSLRRMAAAGRDRAELVAFMTRHPFPFHVRSRWTREQIDSAIDDGTFGDDDNDSYWIDVPALGRIGLIRFEDLSDGTPLFDLRLATEHRGRGHAAEILRAASRHVFTTMPAVNRFEGQTREDNVAMRRAFLRCGWVKEAHYREGWPVDGGPALASVGYAILRRDWVSGGTTPVPGEDIVL